MPPNLDDDVLYRLLDDRAYAFRQRRVFDERKFDKRIFLAASPVPKQIFR